VEILLRKAGRFLEKNVGEIGYTWRATGSRAPEVPPWGVVVGGLGEGARHRGEGGGARQGGGGGGCS
jgi:hypothetical protein